MRILLTTINAKYIHVNLAIRQLYALYHKEYSGLRWHEFTLKNTEEEIADYCMEYDLVCFSCYIWNISATRKAIAEIKRRAPQIKILLGGPEVSYEWQEIINEVDYIVVGEGERAFGEILQHWPTPKNIPGLVSRYQDQVHYEPPGTAYDLNNYENILPYAYEDPETLPTRVAYVETSRGCPYKCEFCLASLDNKVRYLPINHIRSTLLYMMNHGKVIKFLDRTFNIKRDFTLDMFQFILDHHKPNNVFQFEITADIVHPDIIKFIQEKVPKGLFRFEIGIQTVNQKANLEVSRKQNFEKTKSIIYQLRDYVDLHLDLIVGLPLDEWEDIKYSFEEVFKLYAPELQLGFLKFLKGTPMRVKTLEHGYIYDPEPPYEIIRSKYLSEEQLSDIRLVENCLEIYWNKPRAKNMCRYIAEHYSIFDFFLGLGRFIAARKKFYEVHLEELFTSAMEFVKINFSEDSILQQMIALDYLLAYKVRPKLLFDIYFDNKLVNKLSLENELDIRKYRYRVLPLEFDLYEWIKNKKIVMKNSNAWIQYDGIKYPSIIFLHKKNLENA